MGSLGSRYFSFGCFCVPRNVLFWSFCAIIVRCISLFMQVLLNLPYFWADLSRLQGYFPGPWLFVGDFTIVLAGHEKLGRRPPHFLSCNDFWLRQMLIFYIIFLLMV